MTAKDRHKEKILRFLGDPENDYPPRQEYAKLLGITVQTFYHHFSPAELIEIEAEAYEARKARSAKQRSHVLKNLYERAIGYSHPDIYIGSYQGEIIKADIIKHYPPDPVSAREFLDRTEGKVIERKQIETVAPAILQDNINLLTEDQAADVYKNVMG
jgi:dGTP triphosphohydrolase